MPLISFPVSSHNSNNVREIFKRANIGGIGNRLMSPGETYTSLEESHEHHRECSVHSLHTQIAAARQDTKGCRMRTADSSVRNRKGSSNATIPNWNRFEILPYATRPKRKVRRQTSSRRQGSKLREICRSSCTNCNDQLSQQ